MHKKGVLAAVGRVLAAGVLASAILTVFHGIYHWQPQSVVAADGASDFKYEPHAFWITGDEGFAVNETNNDGYMNTFDYTPGMPVDVLIMGASNMEASSIPKSQSAAARLNAMLEEKTVYNIGISMHSLVTCLVNLPAALKKYRPTSYVALEATSLSFPAQTLREALDGTTVEMALQDNILKKNPFIRSTYAKLRPIWEDHIQPLLAAAMAKAETVEETPAPAAAPEDAQQLLDELIGRAARQLEAAGVQGILFYHPATYLDSNGDLMLDTDESEKEAFAALCARHGLIFLDMSDRFLAEYQSSHILPYGFANSAVGSGHMNCDGHRMLAEELYAVIKKTSG